MMDNREAGGGCHPVTQASREETPDLKMSRDDIELRFTLIFLLSECRAGEEECQ